MIGLLSSLFGFGSGWLVVRTVCWDLGQLLQRSGLVKANSLFYFTILSSVYSASMAGQYACAMSPVWQTPVLFICDVCACFFLLGRSCMNQFVATGT